MRFHVIDAVTGRRETWSISYGSVLVLELSGADKANVRAMADGCVLYAAVDDEDPNITPERFEDLLAECRQEIDAERGSRG